MRGKKVLSDRVGEGGGKGASVCPPQEYGRSQFNILLRENKEREYGGDCLIVNITSRWHEKFVKNWNYY